MATAIANTSTYIQGGLEYTVSTSSSGITVSISFYMRRTNTYSGSTYSSSVTQQLCISSDPNNYSWSQDTAITVAGGQQNVWQGPYFTASRTFDASRGGQTIYIGWKTTDNVGGYLGGSGNAQITLPTTATAPTGLAVSNAQKYQNSFAATVSVTGWGGAGDASSRYRELQVWTYNASSLVEPRKYQADRGNAMSSVITVDNNSGYGTLTIEPNTVYTIGMYATNGTYNTGSQRVGDWTTLPPTPSLTNTAVTTNSATFSYSVPNQGGNYDMAVKYQLNSGSLVNVTTLTGSGTKNGSFTVSNLAAGTTYTIVVSLTTTIGEVVSNTVTFTTTALPSATKLYGGLPIITAISATTPQTDSYGTDLVVDSVTANTLAQFLNTNNYSKQQLTNGWTSGGELILTIASYLHIRLQLSTTIGLSNLVYNRSFSDWSTMIAGLASDYGINITGTPYSIVTSAQFTIPISPTVASLAKKINKLYLSWKKVNTISADTSSSYINSFDPSVFKTKLESTIISNYIGEGGRFTHVEFERFTANTPVYTMTIYYYDKDNTLRTSRVAASSSMLTLYTKAGEWGFSINNLTSDVLIKSNFTTTYNQVTKKIIKLYGSANGQTKLIFED